MTWWKNTVYCKRVYILKVSDIKLHTYAYRWHMYAKSNANQPLVWSSYIIIISQSRFFPERSSQFFSEVQMDSHQNLHDQKKCKAHLQIRPALPILVTGIRLKASESVAPGRSAIFVVKLTEVFFRPGRLGSEVKKKALPLRRYLFLKSFDQKSPTKKRFFRDWKDGKARNFDLGLSQNSYPGCANPYPALRGSKMLSSSQS